MKTSKLFLLPLLAGVRMALATGPHHENPPPIHDPVNTEASAQAASTARSDANASATSDSSSGASSESSSNSGGNSISSSTVYKAVRQAPGAFAMGTNTTQPCSGEWHLGGSSPIGGVSFGKSRTNRDCMFAELAADELARGNVQASIQLRCRISYYVEALGGDCAALLNTQGGDKTRVRQEVRVTAVDPAKREEDRSKLLKEVQK